LSNVMSPKVRLALMLCVEGKLTLPLVVATKTFDVDELGGWASPCQFADVFQDVPVPFVPPSQTLVVCALPQPQAARKLAKRRRHDCEARVESRKKE
jgi:hypothetical protein